MSKKIITNNKPNGKPAIPISFPPYVNALYRPSSHKARDFLPLLTEGPAMLGESIKIMLPRATGLVKQISFGGLGRRKCQSIRKAFPYVKGALSSLKKWISRQYLHLVQAENICLKSALEGKSTFSLITRKKHTF
jgi:hypothetical protein